jgi:hypothetical protein
MPSTVPSADDPEPVASAPAAVGVSTPDGSLSHLPDLDALSPLAALATDDALVPRIERVASRLRATLTPLVEQLAGSPPRPVRLTRANPGPGLDKSLASRLVAAAKADSDLQFLHVVPSPTGLRMLLQAAEFFADPALIRRTGAEIDDFQSLLDALPGGRQALDARLGESQSSIREKREQIARQGAFKSVSFLFGHWCETLATTLIVFPSATAGRVDLVEIHRRIGLRRLVASAPLPLLSLFTGHAPEPTPDDAAQLASVDGDEAACDADHFLLTQGTSQPAPALVVEREGRLSTFLLPDGNVDAPPLTVTTAYRLLRAESVEQEAAWNVLRTYMLHTPCRRLVRDVWIADGLWPGAAPEIAWYLPGPGGTPRVVLDPALPHYRRVNLTTHIEQRPHGPAGLDLPGVADHAGVVVSVLRRAGLDPADFRGWRCEMTYPVPLVEMNIVFRFGKGRRATDLA